MLLLPTRVYIVPLIQNLTECVSQKNPAKSYLAQRSMILEIMRSAPGCADP